MITQLSEQISSLNDRMEEFTTRMEELNSKLVAPKNAVSDTTTLNNSSAPTSHFINGLGSGSLKRNSSSSSQLARESPLMEEVAT